MALRTAASKMSN